MVMLPARPSVSAATAVTLPFGDRGEGAMGRQQELVYHVEREEFPRDFPERLEAFVEAAGLSWRGLHVC